MDTVGDRVAGDPAAARPRMPAELVVAAVAYFALGVVLLAGKVVAFLTPDPYSGARFVPGDQEYGVWLGWLIPVVVVTFAFMIRGGGNGVRVPLTVIAVLLGLAAVGSVMDRDRGESVAVEIVLLALLATAVALHHLPRSNAYVRAVRRARLVACRR